MSLHDCLSSIQKEGHLLGGEGGATTLLNNVFLLLVHVKREGRKEESSYLSEFEEFGETSHVTIFFCFPLVLFVFFRPASSAAACWLTVMEMTQKKCGNEGNGVRDNGLWGG